MFADPGTGQPLSTNEGHGEAETPGVQSVVLSFLLYYMNKGTYLIGSPLKR